MTQHEHVWRGHAIRWDGERWLYAENGLPVSDDPYRECGRCDRHNRHGHDHCLGTLPGVINACCGHGQDEEAYVVLDDGTRMSGAEALLWIAKCQTECP